MSDYSSELDSMRVQIHFKENSTPSIHAGPLTDESKAQLLALLQRVEVEARIDERVKATVELYDQSPKDRQLFNNIGNAHRDRLAELKALQSTDKGGE